MRDITRLVPVRNSRTTLHYDDRSHNLDEDSDGSSRVEIRSPVRFRPWLESQWPGSVSEWFGCRNWASWSMCQWSLFLESGYMQEITQRCIRLVDRL